MRPPSFVPQMNPSGDLFVLLVSLIEFVDASCRVHEFHLSCIERVGCVGDFDFYYRILYAVDFESFLRVCARAGDEHLVIRHILESYKTVVFGMNSFFHFLKNFS